MRIRAVNVTHVYPQTCVKQIIKCTERQRHKIARVRAYIYESSLIISGVERCSKRGELPRDVAPFRFLSADVYHSEL